MLNQCLLCYVLDVAAEQTKEHRRLLLWQRNLRLLLDIMPRPFVEKRFNGCQVVSTALMTALSFGNHWEHCLHIAADLGEKVTQTTSNALATCLQRSAQWAWVLSLLEQMETGRGQEMHGQFPSDTRDYKQLYYCR